MLVSDGFAWGAFILGPVWLAAHRTWLAASISLAAYVVIGLLAPPVLALILIFASAVFLGLYGHDLQAQALEHRGYSLVQVVTGKNCDAAWMRLMAHRPDLATSVMANRS